MTIARVNKSLTPSTTVMEELRLLANDLAVETIATSAVKEPARKVRPPSKRASAAAKAMLEQWGQFMPLTIGDDGTIIAGYEFLIAARELGWETIKVIRLSNLSREHARVLSIALARLPELSSWDEGVLRLEFNDLLSTDFGFDLHDLTGFNIAELDLILEPDGANDNPDPMDEAQEPPPDSETVTRHGDLWLMGSHRIICGNSLEAETYDRLMDGYVARTILSDPPFNLKISGHVSGLGAVKHGEFAMASGEMSFAEFTDFLKAMLMLSTAHLMDGGLAYVFMCRRHLEELLSAARQAGLSILDLCIWSKMSGGMGSMYRSAHEPCYAFKKGKESHLNNIQLGRFGRYRTNVWEHRGLSSFSKGRAEALADHPTVKPVNLLAEAIKDCTKRGDIVLDNFAGSGSTLIAAEKSGRVGYGIELEPKYVDVIVRRWEKMTGKEAVLDGTALTFARVQFQRQSETERPRPDAAPAAIPGT